MMLKTYIQKIKIFALWILLLIMNSICTLYISDIFIFDYPDMENDGQLLLQFIFPLVLWGIYTDVFNYLNKSISLSRSSKFIVYAIPLLTMTSVYLAYFIIYCLHYHL